MSNENNDLNSEFLELYGMLNKSELKKINNQIAEERVEEDGPVRKLGNIAERAASILSGSGNKIPYTSEKDDKRFIELAKEIISNRENRNMGGILQEDSFRLGYAEGPTEEEVELMEQKAHLKDVLPKDVYTAFEKGTEEEVNSARGKAIRELGMDADTIQSAIDAIRKSSMQDEERVTRAEGGDVDEQMSMLMGPTHTMPDGTVMPGATHEEGEMLPDDEMEDNYLDFIIDEALSEEEEDMLMSKLEQDEELSMLFDKVIEVASEFAGSGPVEGPGTGVSDSIPARLSDGEFVFTAKAVEEIGADNLMAMMKEAEMKADERQGMANGGPLEEERVVLEPTQEPVVQKIEVAKETVDETARPIQDTGEQELSMSLRANMLDPSKRYVRS